ncbi:MAG: carbohydrate porin [Pseudomonadota bacterium]
MLVAKSIRMARSALRLSFATLLAGSTLSAAPALAEAGDSFDLAFAEYEAEEQGGTDSETKQDTSPPPPPAAPPARPKPPSSDFKLVVSQFVDAPVSGSADDTVRYSGRADAYIDLRGSNWGLDDSWNLKLRPELRWGKDSNGVVGLIPNNTALFRPEGTDEFDLSLSVKKTWSSGASLEVGKVNVLDISGALPIVASDGHFGFQNLGIALPPTAVVPNTLTGALLEVPTKKVIYRLWMFDPDSQYGRTGFETAFESGVGFLASAAALTRFGGKPGVYNFALVGSTRSGPATDILPTALTPPPNGNFGNEEGELALQLSGFQYLSLNPRARGKGIGLFARFQASMGDPTFLDYSGFFGISGNPINRPQDRFGLAYFRYSLTDELVDDIAFRLPIEDEQGVEAFYTFGLAKGWELTANVQVIDGAITFRDTGVIGGIRLTTTL